MKAIGIIPARYNSSRIPGKPLVDICGKPMVWWVYEQVIKTPELEEVYVATDSKEVLNKCGDFCIPCIMTSDKHPTPTDRIHEVSRRISSDIYVFIGGDEPLIEPDPISKIVGTALKTDDFFVVHAMETIKTAAEVIDPSNVKVVASNEGDGLYASRSPLPYPFGSLEFNYMKTAGIAAYTKEALEFYAETPQSQLEKIEECDLIRFIEHKKNVKFVDVMCNLISVDTTKDLMKVREIIKMRIEGDNALSL